MLKIALHGKFGSGKSTFLSIAQELHPELEIKDAKFAHYLYVCMNTIQNLLNLNSEKDGSLLQFIGTHYREKYGGNFWVKKFFNRLDLKDTNHIVTDLRYMEELERCELEGYVIVKIVRDDGFRYEHLHSRDPNHISETALDGIPNSRYDYLVNNNVRFLFSFNAFKASML